MNYDKWKFKSTPLVAMKLAEEVGEVMADLLDGKTRHAVEELDHVIGIATILRTRLDKSKSV